MHCFWNDLSVSVLRIDWLEGPGEMEGDQRDITFGDSRERWGGSAWSSSGDGKTWHKLWLIVKAESTAFAFGSDTGGGGKGGSQGEGVGMSNRKDGVAIGWGWCGSLWGVGATWPIPNADRVSIPELSSGHVKLETLAWMLCGQPDSRSWILEQGAGLVTEMWWCQNTHSV